MSGRRPLIAGNWKMHKTCDEAVKTAQTLARSIPPAGDTEVMIAPPFTALAQVFDVIKNSPIELGAQNLHWKNQGAYTGEISAAMLKSTGCGYAIIGHSERRQFFGETDATVNLRIKAAIAHSLNPVLCVGETEEERDAEATFKILDRQVNKGLEGLVADQLPDLVIAYEPVWAIGTGKTATIDQAQEAHWFIRSLVEKRFGNPLANCLRILYGGSVKPNNISDLMTMADVDGALVGGASLEAETFIQIVSY